MCGRWSLAIVQIMYKKVQVANEAVPILISLIQVRVMS